MGQKVHPKGFRLGVIESWDSRWFARREYAELLHEDITHPQLPEEAPLPRRHLEDRDRARRQQGQDQHPHRAPRHRDRQEGRRDREAQGGARTSSRPRRRFINIHEVRRPDIDAQLVAENVALQLERRVAFRRAMKEAVARAMRMGAQGIRIQSSGRLGGAEIARTRVVPRGPRAAAHAARRHRLRLRARRRPPTASSASRSGSSAARC